ncbi:IpaC/SipC family type III secretion system effector [Klebsiella sp. BIGb0407]|uniref:IpaC/SipC family type III secretion system effector n=1 Tax=Klebsiella sp. BIGb0407 TaxID=2940603 RepID=UPI002168D848|nr:IpaC/SipC family type III secretion system effector [Klebsiella sp. BIGb0407]MCS3431536.1 hypothetical protein [Klebsiella sp. BIGb0407]
MNNIAISDGLNYAIEHSQINNVEKVSEDNNFHLPVTANVQSFVALAMQHGMMNAILQDQSVMPNPDMRPALLEPLAGREKIDSEQKSELMNLIATMKGGDINKLERAAALAATVFTTQTGLQQTAGSAANGNKASPVASSSVDTTAGVKQPRTPVEGGTDITAPDAPKHLFPNMMGDMKMVELLNLLAVTLAKQEAEFNQSSAKSSMRAVDAAERSGNKGIDAEKQRMTGAITSGAMGLVGQGVTTTKTMKALKGESKSIGNNLGSAIKNERELGIHKASTGASTDGMLHQGKGLGSVAENKIGAGNSTLQATSDSSRHAHNKIQLKTNQTRIMSDYSNTAITSSQKIVDGAFNVQAAGETKQAELARADQTVNNEVANTHQLAAKKSAESKATLNQVLEGMLNSKNSTLSSIADRIR